MKYMITLNICPMCGQIIFGRGTAVEACCPVCHNNWKLYPDERIEVRLSQ